jgi:hypothetical protein
VKVEEVESDACGSLLNVDWHDRRTKTVAREMLHRETPGLIGMRLSVTFLNGINSGPAGVGVHSAAR